MPVACVALRLFLIRFVSARPTNSLVVKVGWERARRTLRDDRNGGTENRAGGAVVLFEEDLRDGLEVWALNVSVRLVNSENTDVPRDMRSRFSTSAKRQP